MNFRQFSKTTGLIVILVSAGAAQGRSYYSPDYGYDWDNDNREAKHACKDEVRERIWSDHRYLQKVKFHNDYRFRNESRGRTRVTGSGRYLNRKGHWRNFSFSCVYDSRREEVLNASYRKHADNDNTDYGYYDHARSACRHEIDRKVLREHEAASRIHWNDRTVRRRNDDGYRVSYRGSGQFTGGRGHIRHFDFSCTYDQRRDDVVDAWVDVRRR